MGLSKTSQLSCVFVLIYQTAVLVIIAFVYALMSVTGAGNGNPLGITAWKIPWTGAWQTTVHGVAKSWTQLSD